MEYMYHISHLAGYVEHTHVIDVNGTAPNKRL